MVNPETCDAAELLKAFESKSELLKTLVGNLYPAVLADEIETIGQWCVRRFGCHPNWLRERGIVPASWTDILGITHVWVTGHRIGTTRPDDPVRTITCLECAAR